MTPLIQRDPVEQTDEFKRAALEAGPRAHRRMEADPSMPQRGAVGYAPLYWRALQRILREEFGVNWRTPSEMNPGVCID